MKVALGISLPTLLSAASTTTLRIINSTHICVRITYAYRTTRSDER